MSQRLRPFQVLLGPNGSGKSTLADALGFLCDLQQTSVEGAIYGDHRLDVPMRAPDPQHLTWMRGGERFELALEASIPEELRDGIPGHRYSACRYEVVIDVGGPPRVTVETVLLGEEAAAEDLCLPIPDERLAVSDDPGPRGWSFAMSAGPDATRSMHRIEYPGDRHKPPHSVRRRSGEGKRAWLPEYGPDCGFPILTWLCQLLAPLQRVCLSGQALRDPSPPSTVVGLGRDGGNLANFLHHFKHEEANRYEQWIQHVREALPEIADVRTHERPEDHHRYAVVKYRNGLEAPSWLVSEGTLRLLALTSLAYAPSTSGPCVIEEPENGIHPKALETVIQSLSSTYDRQILLATHSPLIAAMVEPRDVLCFGWTPEAGTTVVPGDEHPRLKNWQGSTDLGTLMASGVL